MDINEEIKNLTKNFQELIEGHNLRSAVTRAWRSGKIDVDKSIDLGNKAMRIPSLNDIHVDDEGNINTKGLTGIDLSKSELGADRTDDRHERSGRNIKELRIKRKNDEKTGFKQATEKAKAKHSKVNEDSIAKQILDLTEAYANLLEANDKRGGAQKEVNKITRTKKDKNGEPVEVVSVADELFPYKGTAKEQYNQKILAKINDMIEGTATLDDLIQLVRQKKATTMKESLQETLDEMMAVTEAIEKYVDSEGNTHELEFNVNKDRYYFDHKINGKSVVSARDSEPNASYERKCAIKNHGLKKVEESLQETLDKIMTITEEIINEVSVKRWKEAAKNSIEGRKQAASDASDRFGSVVYPFRPEVNDPGNKLGNAWDKAEQRADRAEQLAKNLPDSNRPANQLKQAAKKVVDQRDKDNEGALDNLQKAYDKYIEKQSHDDEDRKEIIKTQHNWVEKQEKENKARNLVGKPERRPEKNSEGKHKLKEQGYIDRSNEALSESKTTKESLQETLDKIMTITEEIINEKNANKTKKNSYEINRAEEKQGELEYDPFYRKDAGSVKYANQNTIRELKKIKPTNYTQGQALKSAQLSLAQQTRDTLGREDHPENPYKKPFVWAKGYKNLYGNLNQKAFERKGYGNFKIKKDSNSPVKDLVKTSIEQEKKIKPNLPKPTKESLQETLNQMMVVAEAIKDNVKYHFTGTDGSAVFSYKGNDYSYTPGKKSNKLVNHGPSKDTRGPVTKAIDDANATFDNARQEKYGTERLKRTANKKLNKLVKDLEKTEGKNSFPAKTTPEIEKAVRTANSLTDKSLAADKKFTEVNKAQKKDSESGLVSGLKTEDTEIYNTKKGDSIGFKPVVKKN